MSNLNCIIVEDEIMARISLEKMCKKSENLEVVASFENAEGVQEILKDKTIDLIFLDIEMPGMSGLELLDKLSYIPQVIFTTSKKEYAFDAYEYDVTDFLKKPVTQARFLQAVEKAVQRSYQLNAVAKASAKYEIYIKVDGALIRLDLKEILFFENFGDYVKVITTEKEYTIYATMKYIDQQINHPRFLKVHRSYIVNLGKIVDIEENSLVIGRKVIPISRAFKPILMSSINIL